MLGFDGKFQDASDAFKEIGKIELKSNLTKYNASESFFKSTLLLLAHEVPNCEGTKSLITEMEIIDKRFEMSPHVDFIYNIIEIICDAESSVHYFIDHIYEFNQMFDFDELTFCLLEKVFHYVQKREDTG